MSFKEQLNDETWLKRASNKELTAVIKAVVNEVSYRLDGSNKTKVESNDVKLSEDECFTIPEIVSQLRNGTIMEGVFTHEDLNEMFRYNADRIETSFNATVGKVATEMRQFADEMMFGQEIPKDNHVAMAVKAERRKFAEALKIFANKLNKAE